MMALGMIGLPVEAPARDDCAGVTTIGGNDLAPSVTSFRTVAVKRSAGQWNNADHVEFEADGIKTEKGKNIGARGDLNPHVRKDTNT